MDKVIKNKSELELVANRSSGYGITLEKFAYSL